jgi:hypothetical protein
MTPHPLREETTTGSRGGTSPPQNVLRGKPLSQNIVGKEEKEKDMARGAGRKGVEKVSA